MNIISHILYPVVFSQSANVFRTHSHKPSFFNWKQLLLIGFCGGLPDILSPHTGLQDRYASFTHSLWFLLLALSIAIIFARKLERFQKLIFFCFFAVAFHLICDLIAGGINVFAPFRKEIIGKYYLPWKYWVPLDITGILLFLVLVLYNRCPVGARPVMLATGCSIALIGAGFAFSSLDTETILLKRIPALELNSAQLAEAERAWNTLYAKWKSGTFEAVSNRFNEDLRKALTPQLQEDIFRQISKAYGDYQRITFVEAITGRFAFPRAPLSGAFLYRFKGSFSKTSHQPEIGILFDANGKISSFRFSDTFSKSLQNR